MPGLFSTAWGKKLKERHAAKKEGRETKAAYRDKKIGDRRKERVTKRVERYAKGKGFKRRGVKGLGKLTSRLKKKALSPRERTAVRAKAAVDRKQARKDK